MLWNFNNTILNKKLTVKVLSFIILIMILLCCVSCSKSNSCKVIDKNSENLTSSMRDFFDTTSTSYGESTNFMAKIISFDKVPFKDSITGDTYIYRALVIIAPRCDKEIKLDYFTFSLSDQAEKYYSQFPHLASYSLFNLPIYSSESLPIINGIDDAQAYYFNLTFDNAGKENQSSYGLSEEEFDEMIKELNITIKYKGGEDTIKIDYLDEINFYQTPDEVPLNHDYLKDLFEGNLDSQPIAGWYKKDVIQ